MLKKILIGLGVLILVYVIVCAIAPKRATVVRSTVVKSSKASAFNCVADVKNWEKWSPWNEYDPNMKITYFGTMLTKGSGYSWESEVKNVGNGKLTVTDIYPSDSVFMELDFMENGKGSSAFYVSGNDGEVTVTWTMTTEEFPFFLKPMAWMMDKMLSPDFEKGLKKISEVAPTIVTADAAPAKEPEGIVGVQDVPESILVTYKCTADTSNISAKLGEAYGVIGKVMQANEADFAGPVGAIYYKNEPNSFEFDAFVPVNKDITADVKPCVIVKTSKIKALVYNYYGPYMEMYKGYDIMKEYLKTNNLKQDGPSWEQYVTDPITVKDPGEVLSKIYIPVK